MQTFLRRLRGLIGLGIFSATAWAAVGLAIMAVISVVDPASIDAGEGALTTAFVLARAGFVAGVMAGVVLAIAERRSRLRDLVLPRIAIWGALGGLALPLLGGAPRAMTLILTVLGSGTAVAAVALARRAERISAGSSDRKSMPRAMSALGVFLALTAFSNDSAGAQAGGQPGATSCDNLASLALPSTRILSASGRDARNAVRLFMLPGVDHCSQGEGTYIFEPARCARSQ